MFRSNVRRRSRAVLMAGALGLAATATPALAQTAPGAQVDSRALLELMVAKGLVSRAEADQLISQATVPAPVPQGGVDGDVQTIPYIPQTVRNQIKEELRAELATQANAEGWAKPGEVAEWTKRIELFGDIRVRGEGILMGDGNGNRVLENFAAINAGDGYDIGPGNLMSPPAINTSEDRFRARIRARLGLKARIDDWITGEVRIATGSDTSPVSTNQSLGANGEFGKYAVWLDRANIRLTPVAGVDMAFGRFENPFRTTELMFDDDLNFDGVAISAAHEFGEQFGVFGTIGAFPIFNTSFNFGSTEAGAFSSRDKYLLAGQIGVEVEPVDSLKLMLAAGYFHFGKTQGRVSSPCFFDQDVCDTDITRPAFQQFGNSVFPIRDIVPDTTDLANSPEVQYFGLAAKFRVLNLRARVDYAGFGDVGVRLEGDFIKNVGLKNADVAFATNNRAPTTTFPNPDEDPTDPDDDIITVPGGWDGGDIGWYGLLTVGQADLAEPGDWRAFIGYRRLETDATLDAFTDSDLRGVGGTNVEGWQLGGGYAIGRNTAAGIRWLSADAIVGPTFNADVVQIDLTTKF